MLIIFGIAVGCVLAERLWPAMELPRVNAWWARVILINLIQLGITVLPAKPGIVGWITIRSFTSKTTSTIGPQLRSSIFSPRSLIIGGIGIGMNRHFYGECYIRFIIQLADWKSLPAFTNIQSRF